MLCNVGNSHLRCCAAPATMRFWAHNRAAGCGCVDHAYVATVPQKVLGLYLNGCKRTNLYGSRVPRMRCADDLAAQFSAQPIGRLCRICCQLTTCYPPTLACNAWVTCLPYCDIVCTWRLQLSCDSVQYYCRQSNVPHCMPRCAYHMSFGILALSRIRPFTHVSA